MNMLQYPSSLITGDISIDKPSSNDFIMSYEAGTNLSINCSCSNPNYTTILWEINLQNFTKKHDSHGGSVTIHRIISYPVSFTCCQHHTKTWWCTRSLHINLIQQEEMIQGMCYGLGFCY